MSLNRQKILNAGPTYGSQPNMSALDVAFSIHASVEGRFYEALYPEHEWYKFLRPEQVKSDISAGATTYAYVTRDKHGTAAFVGNGPNNNIPKVGQSMGAVQVPVAVSAVGAQITNEDARQYQQGFNASLPNDLGDAMRKACDNLVETSTLFGSASIGFKSMFNYEGIPSMLVPAGVSGQTEWENKTPTEMANDIFSAIEFMWINGRTLFVPNVIGLPMAQFARIGRTPMVLAGVPLQQTVLEFVIANNIAKRLRGIELEIIPSKYLAGFGAGGTDRMVLMDRNPDNQCLPFPLPYTMYQPFPAPLGSEWYSEQKFGSFHVRQQGSMAYFDGI